jgi:hypothetical protein
MSGNNYDEVSAIRPGLNGLVVLLLVQVVLTAMGWVWWHQWLGTFM